MTKTRDADAEVVIERDPLGRRTPSGLESRWDYDAGDRPETLRAGARTLTFGYDPAGREVARLLDTGTIIAQRWDADHRLTAQTVSTVAGSRPRARRSGTGSSAPGRRSPCRGGGTRFRAGARSVGGSVST